MSGKAWLIIGGSLSAIAALAHLAIIVGGPAWYRFFGAGERMAEMAERGHSYPALITLGIATILALWAAYAFSGAGLLPRLPLLRTALVAITAIYLLRALAFVPVMAASGAPITPFAVWSSLIVLVYGFTHALGTWQRWPLLAPASGPLAP
ncbi:MAG: hypothetical protein AAFW97_02055 [Pseudomonadota bacterium]